MAPSSGDAEEQVFEVDYDFGDWPVSTPVLDDEETEDIAVAEEDGPDSVVLKNRLRRTNYVPTKAGTLRLGPKASEVIEASDVTEETRREETEGRIHIRNL